jgi:hypothetical protein
MVGLLRRHRLILEDHPDVGGGDSPLAFWPETDITRACGSAQHPGLSARDEKGVGCRRVPVGGSPCSKI